MTVSELIEKLKECPENMRVVVEGYESGFDDIQYFYVVNCLIDSNEAGNCEGTHDEFRGSKQSAECVVETCLVLPRQSC
jgi:hypothetical protein